MKVDLPARAPRGFLTAEATALALMLLVAGGVADQGLLLSVTVVLADIRDGPAMNRAWDHWLDPVAKPARMTIEARLVDPSWRVEITGVAALPGPEAERA